MIITEPDVALTDYGLAAECFLSAYFLGGQKAARSGEKDWIVVGFSALGMASLFGGSVHGFFVQEITRGYRILWPLTLLSIAVTALAGWIIAARILFSSCTAKKVSALAVVAFAVYAMYMFFYNQTFLSVIFFYLPAALILWMAVWKIYWRNPALQSGLSVLGIFLTFVAPFLQQAKWSLPILHLNYNAVYHIIQAIAIAMIFYAARWYIGKEDLL